MKRMFCAVVLLLTCTEVIANRDCKPSPEVDRLITHLEEKNQLPKNSFRAILNIESCFDPNAINDSSKIASFGLGQLTEATAEHHCGLGMEGIFKYFPNANCAAKVFTYQYKRFNRNLIKTVLAYNEGTPCICNGTNYVRDLGKNRVQVCKEWEKVDGSWTGVPIKCSVSGELRITKYYKDWHQQYKMYNSK